MIKIDCLDPVTIVNPKWRESVINFNTLITPDCSYRISPLMRQSLFDKTSVFQFFSLRVEYRHLPDEEFDKYFFINIDYTVVDYGKDYDAIINSSTDGVIEPLFVKVPCGHCDICNMKRQNSIVQRMLMASQQSKSSSLFVTLTYNNVSLPRDGVNKRDCINFKKRFRTYAERYLRLSHDDVLNIKFCIFPEYGKTDEAAGIAGRPHYHVVIFGCPVLDEDHYKNYHRWTRFIRFCWRFSVTDCRPDDVHNNFDVYEERYSQVFNLPVDYDPLSMGFVNVNFTNDSKALSYVSKYVTKSCVVPEGQKELFPPLMSVNLGVDFVKQNFDYDEYFRTLKMSYLNVYTGKTDYVSLSSYYLAKLFPSWSNMVSSDFRKHYYSAVSYLQSLVKTNHLVPSLRFTALGVLDNIYEKFPFMPLFEDAYKDARDEVFIAQCQDAFDNTIFEEFPFCNSDEPCPIYFYFPCLADDLIFLQDYQVDIGVVNEVQKLRVELFNRFPERNDQSDRALKYRKNLSKTLDSVKL